MVTTGKTQEALAVAASDPSTRALHTPKPGGRWQGARGRAARAGRAGAAGATGGSWTRHALAVSRELSAKRDGPRKRTCRGRTGRV